MTDARSQRDKTLAVLVAARGEWVPATKLAAISLQYSSRVFEIRKKLGIAVENRTTIVNGVKHGEFRLVTGPTAEFLFSGPEKMRERRVLAREWIANARTEPKPSTESLFGDISPDRTYQE